MIKKYLHIILKIYLWIFVLGFSFATQAQALYPVTASLDIQGPYSPLFYTFGDPSLQAFRPNKIALRLRLNDLSEPNLTVRLKWEVSGPGLDFATQDDYVGNLVDLSPGQFVNFDNGQLSGYFDAIANGGISQRDIDGNGGYLPEGNYTFCVTAYEIAKGQQVSNSTCRSIYIEEYEPPVLNLPDEVVKPSYPQNVLVSWTPRHFTIFPVIYHVKVWDKIEGLTPDQVSMAQLPLIEYDVPQVNQSFITSMQPLLIPGTSYWIQVQVRDNIHPGGLPSVIFKNNGNSEIEEFYYGTEEELQPCTAPLSLIGEVGDDKTLHLTWNSGDALNTPLGGLQALAYSGGSSTLAYLIKYRNIDSLHWIEAGSTSATNYDLTGLKRGKTYEIQVIKVCLNGLEEGPIIQVTIPKGVQRKGECGVPLSFDGLSTEPLDELLEGDTISAGDVLINVLSVDGSSGVFSGTGYFQMPMFGKFRLGVHFHAITVNEDYILTDGEIITNFDQKKADALQSYDITKDLVDVNVIDVKSTFKILKVEAGGCLVEVDGVEKWAPNGTVLKGAFNNVIYNGILFERFEESEEFDSVGSIRIEFVAGENMKYGFDGFKEVIEKEYKMLEGEPIPYKSVAVDATDGVGARIIKGQWNGTDTIFFVEEKTKMIIPYTQSGKEFKLNVPGFGWESDVVAYVDNVGVAGRLHLYSTPITKVNVTVVNVNGAGAANLSSLTEETNKIFAQGLFAVNLHGGAAFNYTETEDGIINVANHFLNAYSPDMKKLADAYFKDNGTIENEFYLFVIDNMEAGTAGMMPQGYAAGFISEKSFNAATIAHELGHGIFNFDHSWLLYPEMAENTGLNLMDYADSTRISGTSLFFRQWQQMVSPGFPKGWRKDEGAGSQLSDGNLDYQCISQEFADIIADEIFVNFNGKPISLSNFGKPLAFYGRSEGAQYQGKLAAFVTFNGTNLGNSLYKDAEDTTKLVFKDQFVEWIGSEKNFVTIPPLSDDVVGNILVFIENDTSNVFFKDKLFEKALKTCQWEQISKDLTEDEKCLEKYKNHPYLREQSPLGTFVNQYPCVLGRLEHFDFKDQARSQYADDLTLIISEMIGIPLLSSFAASMLPELFSEEFMKMILTKKIREAGIAFNLDALIQNTVIYYFPPEDKIYTWQQATNEVDLGQSAIAGLETFVELECEVCEAGVKSAIQCIYSGTTKASNGQIFDNEACGIAFLETVGVEVLMKTGGSALKYLATKVPKNVLLKHLMRHAGLSDVRMAGFPVIPMSKDRIYTFFKSIYGSISTSNVKALLNITDDVAADKIARIIQNNAALEKEIFESGWFLDFGKFDLSSEEIANLIEDFDSKIEMISIFRIDFDIVKAWRKIAKYKFIRKDIDFLMAFKKVLNDPEMIAAPINIVSRVETWIGNSHLKCKTCLGGTEPFLDEVLNNLNDFKIFLSKPGAIEVIDDIGNSTRGAEGANWLMKFTKDKGISPSAFEEIITDGRKFTADIVEGSGFSVKYYECKSWESNMKGLFTGGKTNFVAQFVNYVHNPEIIDLNQFGYHFNPDKWTPNASELNSALKASFDLFKSDPIIWAKYRQLFGPEVENIVRGDFDGLIDIITNNHFSKIVNP